MANKNKKNSDSSGSDEKFKAEAAQRVKNILPILKKTYPDARVALKFANRLRASHRNNPVGTMH